MRTFNFRIFKTVYFESGLEKQSYYHVEEQYKFIGIPLWCSLKQPSYGGRTPIHFETEELAFNYVKKYVNKEPIEGWNKKKTMDFISLPNK